MIIFLYLYSTRLPFCSQTRVWLSWISDTPLSDPPTQPFLPKPNWVHSSGTARIIVNTPCQGPRPVHAEAVQGDTSGWWKPPVDIDLQVAFYYKVLILKRNFQINVNGRFWTSRIVTLYNHATLNRCVIVGYDPRFNYMKLVRAAHHLRDDSVLFLASTIEFR